MRVSQDRRTATRIDKVFRVMISTDELGEQWYVARNVSANGMFVEMAQPLPLRTHVTVHFQLPHETESMTVSAKVQNHYYLHYSDRGAIRGLCGVGLRFMKFHSTEHAQTPADKLH